MLTRIRESLEYMQNKPHKWWKKNKNYIPAKHDVGRQLYYLAPKIMWYSWSVEAYINDINALNNIESISDIKPTPYDYLYAINTEILEYSELTLLAKTSQKELNFERADIGIFAALYLKTFFDIKDFYKVLRDYPNKANEPYELKPIFLGTAHPLQMNVMLELIDLLRWSLASFSIKKKMDYNEKRPDHEHKE